MLGLQASKLTFSGIHRVGLSIALMTFSGVLGGCGQSESTLENDLKNAALTCRSAEQCPLNVGMIFSSTGGNYRSSQCSGFLVADNIVATNSHCIPDSLKSGGACDSSSLVIRFMNAGTGRELYPCKRLIKFSDRKSDVVDYAYFEIEGTGRTPFKIARAGVKDREPIQILRVTPTELGGRIDVDNCEVAHGTLIGTTSAAPWSRRLVAPNCPIVHGNSGSPVVNQRGEAIGLADSFVEDKPDSIKSIADIYNVTASGPMIPNMMFSNFSCIGDPLEHTALNPRCGKQDFLFDYIRNFDRAHNQNWKTQLPPIFGYRITKDYKTGERVATPTCVMPQSLFREYDRYVQRIGKSEVIDIEMPVMLPKPSLTVDSVYRVIPSPSPETLKSWRYRFERSYINYGIWTSYGSWAGQVVVSVNQSAPSEEHLKLRLTDCQSIREEDRFTDFSDY